MRNRILLGLALLVSLPLVGCSKYANVPPSDIGMKLTPTGYEDHVYTPGQVDLGEENQNGMGDRLILIQRSGVEIKEQFIGKEGNPDKEDHRCLTGDRAPMTLDVRLLFALPNYETDQGRKDLSRLFMLGNPEVVKDATPDGRVLRLSAESVYNDQARQQVRGKIRQLCANYKSFETAFDSFAKGGDEGFVHQIEIEVARVLVDRKIPLRLVSAFASNMKPDPSVVEATAAKLAADKRVEAIRTVTDFLAQDPSGGRLHVYNMQVLQEIVSTANNNGHNTIFMTDMGGNGKPLPVPIK